MIRKKILAMAGAALIATSMAACDTSETSTDSAGEDGAQPYVAVVSKGYQHQFWQSVKDGAEKAADEFDVKLTFEGPDTESDIDQQIQMLNTALGANPDALAFAALDSKASGPLLKQADEKGVPVVAFDSGVDSDIPVTTVATDNKAAAAEAAKHMVELIDGEGEVAIIAHDQTSLSATDRRDGFVEYIEDNAPDVKIVDTQYGGGDQLLSTDAAKAMLSANPKLKGMYGTNEGSAIGMVNAVKEVGADDLTLVGFDSGKAQLDAVRSGAMAGAVTQNPVGIGYETVKAAVEAINGDDLEEVTDTGYFWYDADNIDTDEIKDNTYE